jgi:threonine/homoserine/homoserine lactone efflux protein
MGQAIGQVLAFAVAAGLSPIPIVGIVMMLSTPRARSNGPAFLAGWIFGLAGVGTAVLLIASGAEAAEGGEPANWVNVLKLVLGAGLLVLALKQWKGRPAPGAEAELPAWMSAVDHFTAVRSAGLGLALAAVNPKNLILVVGAASAIAGTGAAAGSQAVALAIFVLIGTVGTGVPVLLFFTMGDRSERMLDELKGWMAQNNATIMAVICLLIGAKLLGDGISGLSA